MESRSGAEISASRYGDHGPGIPDEFKGRVFEKFAQADNSDARTKGGVGLGLSVVKQIVTRLGGEVGFANAPGGGAIFHFEVPGWQHDETEAAVTFDATPIAPLCPEHEPKCSDERTHASSAVRGHFRNRDAG